MSRSSRVVLVPGALALLPEYAGLEDPVAELRAACFAAVAWLRSEDEPVTILGRPPGIRVGVHLLDAAGPVEAGGHGSYLVVGNGSARRTEKAPGHLDVRARPFDDDLRAALTAPDPVALGAIELGLGRELWADVEPLTRLAELLTPEHRVVVDYDDDPFGVQYWVMRWEPATE